MKRRRDAIFNSNVEINIHISWLTWYKVGIALLRSISASGVKIDWTFSYIMFETSLDIYFLSIELLHESEYRTRNRVLNMISHLFHIA